MCRSLVEGKKIGCTCVSPCVYREIKDERKKAAAAVAKVY